MGADAFYVYFGVRFRITEAELEAVETRADERIPAARRLHLKTCFGRVTDGNDNFLLVGTEIGRFGVENQTQAVVAPDEMNRIVADTSKRLKEAGFNDEPKFHLQLVAQY